MFIELNGAWGRTRASNRRFTVQKDIESLPKGYLGTWNEKKGVVNEVSSRSNSRIIDKNSSCVPPVLQNKDLASVMVEGAVASNDKSSPFISWWGSEDQCSWIFEDYAGNSLILDWQKPWSHEIYVHPGLNNYWLLFLSYL